MHKAIRRYPKTTKEYKDLTGVKYPTIEVIGFAGMLRNKVIWLCRCKCGRYRLVERYYIKGSLCKMCNAEKLNFRWAKLDGAKFDKSRRVSNRFKNLSKLAEKVAKKI